MANDIKDRIQNEVHLMNVLDYNFLNHCLEDETLENVDSSDS